MSDYFLAGKKGTTEHAAVWVPDSEASTCMHCLKSKFTALNRRVCMSIKFEWSMFFYWYMHKGPYEITAAMAMGTSQKKYV